MNSHIIALSGMCKYAVPLECSEEDRNLPAMTWDAHFVMWPHVQCHPNALEMI